MNRDSNLQGIPESRAISSLPQRARVLIADDHSLIVEAVGQVLENSGQFEYRTTNSIKGVFEALAEDDHFDVILLDVRMPGVSGLDTFSRVMERANGTPIVLFSGEVGARFVEAALKLGVRELIPKSMNLKSLVSALNLIISGEVFIPSELKLSTGEKVPIMSESDLSSLELSILRLAAEGYINKEIGQSVDTSEVAVKMHMRSICKKLNAKNRTHAAMIARGIGLV